MQRKKCQQANIDVALLYLIYSCGKEIMCAEHKNDAIQ